MRQCLFIAIGFAAILSLHLLGLSGWYYSVKFYDKFLHFSAGILLSISMIFLLSKLTVKESIKSSKLFYPAFIFTTVVTISVVWEFFELFFFPQFQLGVSDTLFDIFWAGVGSILTIALYENFRH